MVLACPRIFVVDDNATNRNILGEILLPLGVHCVPFANGRDALNQVATHTPRLLLLDTSLPQAYGYEVLLEWKTNPITRGIPVLVSAAIEEQETIARFLSGGADDYFVSPYKSRLVQTRVWNWLEHKRLLDLDQSRVRQLAKIEHELRRARQSLADIPSEVLRYARQTFARGESTGAEPARTMASRGFWESLEILSAAAQGRLSLTPCSLFFPDCWQIACKGIQPDAELNRLVLLLEAPEPFWAEEFDGAMIQTMFSQWLAYAARIALPGSEIRCAIPGNILARDLLMHVPRAEVRKETASRESPSRPRSERANNLADSRNPSGSADPATRGSGAIDRNGNGMSTTRETSPMAGSAHFARPCPDWVRIELRVSGVQPETPRLPCRAAEPVFAGVLRHGWELTLAQVVARAHGGHFDWQWANDHSLTMVWTAPTAPGKQRESTLW